MIQSRSLRYDEQINQLESLTPILLAMHGTAMLLTLGGNPGSWVLVIIRALLGATVAIQSWAQKKLAVLRSARLIGISLSLSFTTGNSKSFCLPGLFVIVSSYQSEIPSLLSCKKTGSTPTFSGLIHGSAIEFFRT